MKITRLGLPRPVIGLGSISGGTVGAPGTVPTAQGSNGTVSWASNVQLITVNGTTKVLGPFINIANGSNTTVTVDAVGAVASNTIRIHATGGGGSLTVSDEGSPLATSATTLDFVGAGVTATGAGATKTITIPGGGGSGGAGWRFEIDPFLYTAQTNFNTRLAINVGGSGNYFQYLQSGGSQNDVATYEALALEAGTYAITTWMWKSNNHGIVHVQLDGTDLTTFDLYAASPTPDQRLTATGLTVGSDDVYTLGFKMASKNASSSAYYGLIARFVLYRTA